MSPKGEACTNTTNARSLRVGSYQICANRVRILAMRVYVKLIATYRNYLPPDAQGDTAVVDVPRGSTVAAVLTPFGIPLDESSVIVLNGFTVDLNTPVSEGDTIAAFSAIAGG